MRAKLQFLAPSARIAEVVEIEETRSSPRALVDAQIVELFDFSGCKVRCLHHCATMQQFYSFHAFSFFAFFAFYRRSRHLCFPAQIYKANGGKVSWYCENTLRFFDGYLKGKGKN